MRLDNVSIIIENKKSKKTGDNYKVITLYNSENGEVIATSFDKDLRLALTEYILDHEE